MASRLDLHEALCGVLGTRNCYFQPPSSVQMKYPAIVYHRKNIEADYADNSVYMQKPVYEVILIDKNPDSEYVNKLLQFPYCSFDRHYTAENLNHDVFTLYNY